VTKQPRPTSSSGWPSWAGAALLEIYVPRYGAEWESFLESGVQFARIDAERMFTFHMSEAPSA
jgi:hypothetical protein